MKKLVASALLAVAMLSFTGCNENLPGDPNYYSCQYFGTHCHHKHR